MAHDAIGALVTIGLQLVRLVVKIAIPVAASLDLVRVVQDAGTVISETAITTTVSTAVATEARRLEPVSIELAADASPVAIDRLTELS